MSYRILSQKELEAYAQEDGFAKIALKYGMQYNEPVGNYLSVIPYEVAFIGFDWRSLSENEYQNHAGKALKAAAEAGKISTDYSIEVYSNGFSITRIR